MSAVRSNGKTAREVGTCEVCNLTREVRVVPWFEVSACEECSKWLTKIADAARDGKEPPDTLGLDGPQPPRG